MAIRKCYACGYEKKPDEIVTKEILYKTGKKKGQVREVTKETTTYPNFIEVHVRGRDDFSTKNTDRWSINEDLRAGLYACPKCGTIRLESWEHGLYE